MRLIPVCTPTVQTAMDMYAVGVHYIKRIHVLLNHVIIKLNVHLRYTRRIMLPESSTFPGYAGEMSVIYEH